MPSRRKRHHSPLFMIERSGGGLGGEVWKERNGEDRRQWGQGRDLSFLFQSVIHLYLPLQKEALDLSVQIPRRKERNS